MPVIQQVDPHDEQALKAWYRALRAGAAAGRDRPLIAAYQEVRAALREPGAGAERSVWAAVAAGGVVGSLLVELYGEGNRRVAEVDVSVPAGERGQGYGSALLAHAERLAARAGRRVLLAEAHVPAGQAPAEHPGTRFALGRGFRSVHREDHLVLDLPADEEAVAALLAGAARRRSGYRLDTWSGPCPPEFVAEVARLRSAMERAVPTGGVHFAPRTWDPERVREVERRLLRQGFTSIASLARAADGAPAGYSELFVPGHNPAEVYQDDTVVLTPHRGRGLGAALKAGNLARLAADHPERRRVHTWTAAVNGPMQRINRGFGFRPVEVAHRLQRDAR
ncbi:GNAT family N-acetyltransferase [Nocardiopsis potens]|uniref:GNAT family N-acetyltransferase n=1 Tax=Nocardiopsis potens TaxID=1246458 RepID=UPI00034CED69|nr:GNAT family N-acetyltransferase [Nocardiopsis potens]